MPLDATRIAHHLYQGGYPPAGRAVADAGFTTLVLCAEELQPRARRFPDVEIIRAPMDDCEITPSIRAIAKEAAGHVAERVRGSKRVLVTCAQGRNRSGLVVALALRELTEWHGQKCADRVVATRRDALTNRSFRGFVSGLPPRGEDTIARCARCPVDPCPDYGH